MESLSAVQVTLWVLSIALMVVGVAGTVLPALPGAVLVLAGIVLGAWIDDFQHVSGWVLAVVALLAALTFVVDYAAALLGAKRAGASRAALAGAAIGTVAGLAMGFVGVLFLPLVGAVIGELWAQRQRLAAPWGAPNAAAAAGRDAARVGVATWIGLLVGTIAKLVLTFMMIGIFVVALLL